MNRQLADNEDIRKNLHDFKKKNRAAKKNFADFLWFLGKKQLKKALFLRFFEENLMPINAMNKHGCFYTSPGVSREKLKKVPKKVLT